MNAFVKILVTVNLLITCAFAECETTKSSKLPTLGNARVIASKIETIDTFMVDRSTNIGEGIFLKNNKERHESDDRKVKGKDSPAFLDAVGKLTITDSDGKTNYCGGSLVGFTAKHKSRVVVTSAHCLLGNNKVWKTTTKSGKVIELKATTIDFDSKSDYAFLLLEDYVDPNDVAPLIIDYEGGTSISRMMSSYKGKPTVAGYSSDSEVGKGGKVLTYDQNMERIAACNDEVNCPIGGTTRGATTYSGASGGAAIISFENKRNEVNKGLQHVFVGPIKGGITDSFSSSNGVKGSNDTTFTYYERFWDPLYDALVEYNGAVEGIE